MPRCVFKLRGPIMFVRHVLAAAILSLTAPLALTVTPAAAQSSVSSYAPPLKNPKFKGRWSSPRFGDKKRVRFEGRHPSKYAIHGIDISRYNPPLDWKRAQAAGVEFAFIKVTEGRENVDPKFKRHWKGAMSVGMPASPYHFYYWCAPPEAQARNYIRNVPKSLTSLPPVLDLEWNPQSPTCKRRPKKREVLRVVKKWLDIVERHYKQKPIIYVPIDFHRDIFANYELPGYQYWLRSVRAQPERRFGKRPWVFWQYSGTGLATGIKGAVDLNVFNGTREDWNWWVAINTR